MSTRKATFLALTVCSTKQTDRENIVNHQAKKTQQGDRLDHAKDIPALIGPKAVPSLMSPRSSSSFILYSTL